MTFTSSELAIIAKAKKKILSATIIRVLIIIAMLVGITLMFKGFIIAEQFAYGAITIVFIAVAHPQFGTGPKYEDLVTLLENKLVENKHKN